MTKKEVARVSSGAAREDVPVSMMGEIVIGQIVAFGMAFGMYALT